MLPGFSGKKMGEGSKNDWGESVDRTRWGPGGGGGLGCGVSLRPEERPSIEGLKKISVNRSPISAIGEEKKR